MAKQNSEPSKAQKAQSKERGGTPPKEIVEPQAGDTTTLPPSGPGDPLPDDLKGTEPPAPETAPLVPEKTTLQLAVELRDRLATEKDIYFDSETRAAFNGVEDAIRFLTDRENNAAAKLKKKK